MGKSLALASPAKASTEKIILCEAHAAESIRHNVVFALDVGQLGTALFNDEPPPHDTLSIECPVDKILVVREDFDLLTQKDIPTLL